MRKRTTNKSIRDEKGQALVLVLVLMLIGGLIIAPLLSYMSSGLIVGRVYEERMKLFYAADAGVEDGLWQIKYEKLEDLLTGYNEYNYGHPYPYPATLTVNAKNVGVTIENIWIPKDITKPLPAEAELIIEGDKEADPPEPPKLIITGSIPGESTYQIKITYNYGVEGPDALLVNTIGIWLPPGFEYDYDYNYGEDEHSLAYDTDTVAYSVPDDEDYCSGKVVVWNFSSLQLSKFPPDGTGPPMVKSFTFKFTGPSGRSPEVALSWIDTTGMEDDGIDYTWDADTKVCKIVSKATDNTFDPPKETEVVAYTARSEMRELGSTISGDYVAVGNSLMTPDPDDSWSDRQNFRPRLYKESRATITSGTDIPANATVEGAYLYWSGWLDHYYWYEEDGEWYWSDDPDDWSVPQDNWTGLVYDADNLEQMVEDNAKVNTVNFGGGGVQQDITATQWQVWPKTNDSPACWYYTCFYDATDLVNQLIADNKLGSNGSGTYTLGHASQDATSVIDEVRPGDSPDSHTYKFYLCDEDGDLTEEYTGYPLGTPAHKLPSGEWNYHVRYNASYAGWSLIIIYSSLETKGHQLYLYDIANPNFTFKESYPEGVSESNPDFDGDGNPGGKISGFLVPERVRNPDGTWEVNAAKITCFVGEGDENKTGDFFRVTGPSGSWANLPDGTGAALNNVWNSKSVGITAPGVDIDTFYVTWSSGIIEEGDTWAQVDIPTVGDGFTLIYIILSFRSEITSGGTITYLIRG